MSLSAKVPRGLRRELAQRAQISVGYVHQVFAGHKRPTLDIAVRLAVALREVCGVDVSIEELARPAEPWPVDVRWLSCEPALTIDQVRERDTWRIAEELRRQAGDNPPPAPAEDDAA